MNSLTTDSFYAERQRNGDVWISSRSRTPTGKYGHLAPEESEPVIIPADKCRELAELLWPAAKEEEEWRPNYNQQNRVDYTRQKEEPE